MSLMSPALAGRFVRPGAGKSQLTGSAWPTGHTFVAAVLLQLSGAHSLMYHLRLLLYYDSKAESL